MVKKLALLLLLAAGVVRAQGIFEPRMLKQAGATDAQCLTWSTSNSRWQPGSCAPLGSGEANTASNAGGGTFYWFYQKSGVDLQFYTFNATSPFVVTGPTANILTLGVNAASANTVSYLVQRDASGNFSAGTITATLTGNVTGNLTGNVTGNASTATAFAANPTDCTVGQVATSIDAEGDLTCTTAGVGDVLGPAINTDSYIPQWNGVDSKTLKAGLGVASANTASAIVQRDASGNFSAGTVTAALTGNAATSTALAANPADCAASQFATTIAANGDLTCAQPSTTTLSDASNIVLKNAANTWSTGAQDMGAATSFKVPVSAGAAPTTSGFIAYDSTSNTFKGGVNTATKTFAVTDGNIATATALAGNGSNCSAGQFPLGVDASGAVESCTALPTTISGTANEITASAATGAVTLSVAATFDVSGKTSTKPAKTGTAAPGTCAVGELFYDTDATAGQNVYGCTATNVWTLQGDGSGSAFYQTVQDEGSAVTQRDTLNFAGAGVTCADGASKTTCTITSGGSSNTYGAVASLPATCATGDTYRTSDSIYEYQCTATNAWTAFYHGQVVVPSPSTGWSWGNQASSTINSTNGYEYLDVPKSGTVSITMRYRAVPVSTPYTIKFLLRSEISGIPPGSAGTWLNAGVGVGFREDASGKIIDFYAGKDATTVVQVATRKWTNATTFSAAYVNNNTTTGNVTLLDWVYRYERWLAITNDGTNLIYWWSSDGFHWNQYDSQLKANFFTTAPDGYGLVAYANGGAVQIQLLSMKETASATP